MLSCANVAVLALSLGRAAEPPDAEPAPKDHQLFIGLDVFVESKGEVGRVRGVTHGSAEVEMSSATRTIPFRHLVTRRFQHETKISSRRVTITNAQGERIASRLDPSMYDVVIEQAANELAAKQEERREKADDLFVKAMNNEITQEEINESERREVMENAMAQMPNAQMDLFSRDMFLDEDFQRAVTMDGKAALEISFEISAPQTIADGYVTIFAVLWDPADRSVPIHRVIMRKLPPFGRRPVTMRCTQEGMPAGFRLESFDIHVYSGDREIGSNVAQGSVDLTRDEAIKFLRLRHLTSHARDTLHPQPMRDFVPAGLALLAAGEQLKRKVSVTTDREGGVTAVTLDRAGRSAADDDIVAAIRSTPFLPAVRDGRATEGEATLPLSTFLR